jgi:hypothetical protein
MTLVAAIVVNGGTIAARNLDISGVAQVLPIPGVEVAGFAFNLVEHSTLRSSRFSDFAVDQFGAIVVANSTDVLLEDISIEGLVGQRALVVDASIKVAIRRMTVTISSTKSFLNAFHSYDLSIEELKISGLITKQLLIFYDVKLASLASIDLDETLTTETLFQLSTSQISMKNIRLNGLKAKAFCSFTFDTQISIQNVSIVNFNGVFGSFSKSTLTGSGVHIIGGSKPSRDITLDQSQLSFDDFSIEGMKTDFFVIRATRSSVSLKRSAFIGLSTTEDALIRFEASDFTCDVCSVSGLKSKLIDAASSTLKMTELKVKDVDLSQGLSFLSQAKSLIYLEDSDFQLSNSHVEDVKGDYGGFLNVLRNQTFPIRISDSSFVNCSAAHGGVFYFQDAAASISASTFRNNSASIEGGGLVHVCRDKSCQLSVQGSEFAFNTARRGGAIHWATLQPSIDHSNFLNNTATYGPDLSSYGVSLSLLDDQLNLLNESMSSQNKSRVAASSQALTYQLLFGLLDNYGQLVRTDNSSYTVLSALDSTIIAGSASATAREGVFNYSLIKVTKDPTTEAHLAITHSSFSDIDINTGEAHKPLNFTMYMRDCVPGEIVKNSSCLICPSSTYSFDPHEDRCTLCPREASCLGGAAVSLDKGYWRSEPLSDTIYECYLPKYCLGGYTSDCALGYHSYLCTSCEHKWERVGRFQCLECLSTGLMSLKTILMLIVAWIGFGLYNRSLVNSAAPHIDIIVKMLFNFIQIMSFVVYFNIQWPDEMRHLLILLEQLGSLGIQLLTSNCLWKEMDLPNVYVRSMVYSLSPLVFAVCSAAVLGSISWVRKDKKYIKDYFISMNCTFFFLIQPYILKTSLDLLTCRTVDSENSLVADMTIQCWTHQHTLYAMVFAIPSFVVWFLVVPGLMFFVLFKANRSEQWAHRVHYLRFFMFGLKPAFYWWELVLFTRKNAFLCMSSLLLKFERNTQLISGFFVILTALSLQFVYKPYIFRIINLYEYCCLVSAGCFLIFGNFIQASKVDSSVSDVITLVEVCTLLGSMTIFTAFFFYHMSSTKVRRRFSRMSYIRPSIVPRASAIELQEQAEMKSFTLPEREHQDFVPHNSVADEQD